MRLGYAVGASRTVLRHPVQGLERVQGRLDARRDQRAWQRAGVSPDHAYLAVEEGGPSVHSLLDRPWPCPQTEPFTRLWDEVVTELREAKVPVGLKSYRGWNDGDRSMAAAIWCFIAHRQPATVVETGVAHGLTSRIILEALERNHHGRLWSVDLPAVDPALHPEIGIAVPERLRSRWTYVEGTSRQRLAPVLDEVPGLDLFVHDSLHTGRNVRFELAAAWPAVRPGGAAVVDDVERNVEFRAFVTSISREAWFAGHHVTGPGLWGMAAKPAG